jgi:hypothetical protein
MATHMFVAFAALFAAMALGMFVTDKARRTLTPEQKAALLDTLHPLRKVAMIPVIAFAVVIYLRPILTWLVWGGALCFASIYMLKAVAVRRSSAPDIYRGACATEAYFVLAGILFFLAAGLWPTYAA